MRLNRLLQLGAYMLLILGSLFFCIPIGGWCSVPSALPRTS